MLNKLQKRIAKEESGFTLIELLIVLVIIGILLAIAVPSYLGFKDRANKTAAQANVRSAIPAVEAFYSDNGNYLTGGTPSFTIANLKLIDAGLGLTTATGTATTYALCAQSGGYKASVAGPGGTIAVAAGACP